MDKPPKPPLVPVVPLRTPPTPEQVIKTFWEENEEALKLKIAAESSSAEDYNYDRERFSGLNLEQHLQIIFERERAFVDHILTRLITILNEVRSSSDLESSRVVFGIQTTMLYDIDGTLGGRALRPSAVLFFQFLQKYFYSIQMSLLTTRDQETLNRQLVDANISGSLVEIAEYINAGAFGIYAHTALDVRNEDAFDPGFYPKWQREDSLEYVLTTRLGFSTREAETFIDEEWPLWISGFTESIMLSCAELYLQKPLRDKLDTAVRSSKFEDRKTELHNKLLTSILLRTITLAELIDSDANESTKATQQAQMAEDVLKESLSDIPDKQRNLFRPAVDETLCVARDYLSNLRKHARINTIPDGMTGSLNMLRAKAMSECSTVTSDLALFVINTTGIPFDTYTSDLPFAQIHRHCMINETGPSIMRPEFQARLGKAFRSITSENRQHMRSFHRKLSDILGSWVGIPQTLQRLAACKRMLDSGATTVSITVDNLQVAKKMDLLFQGKLNDKNGKPIDAFKLFNLPDKYRGRIYLIHVGELAEYTAHTLTQRIELALAA